MSNKHFLNWGCQFFFNITGGITMRCPKCKRKVAKVKGYRVCLNMKCEELIIEEDADESQTS